MGINENILCGLNDLWSDKDPNISILGLNKSMVKLPLSVCFGHFI